MIDKIQEVIGNLGRILFNFSQSIPRPVRLLIRDILEGAIAAIATIEFFVPQSAEDAAKLTITVVVGVSAAVFAIIRRWIWNQVLNRIDGEE